MSEMRQPTVHIVHCIDTEGPLYEPVTATFERIEQIFGIVIEPTADNLRKLQRREIDLKGLESDVARVISPELLDYNETWERVDGMLEDIMSPAYRNAVPDSLGQGWVYNWYCLDFVGFATNPRRRAEGFHTIFDHYREMLAKTESVRDAIHFHHHPIPFSGEGNHCATHYFANGAIVFEIIARRIIDRQWFPCSNRPGFHTTRPDSQWFMEQYIPFDMASQATDEDYSAQKDVSPGRYGDWRRAPRSWIPYHPDPDDYQVPGTSRRWIARCLNIGSRFRVLTAADVDLAFRESAEGKPVVLCFTHHDFRDMRPAIDGVREMIKDAAGRYPVVEFRYCEAREAMRLALGISANPPLKFSLSLEDGRLSISASSPTFGPQPFLALKTKAGAYMHDNLDIQEPFRRWTYCLDEMTVPLDRLEAIGVGACDVTGNATAAVFDTASRRVTQRHY